MAGPSDGELYVRGCATLVASWELYARGATGAAVEHLPGVALAVFPTGAERDVYNNALLDRELDATGRTAALDAVEAAYSAAGITRYAAWVHESDEALRYDVEARGYTLDTTTRAMGMALDDLHAPRPEFDLNPAGWPEYLSYEGLAPEFLATADHSALHVLAARLDGELIGAALAYDHAGDCGIYNVGTLEHARRRGLGTALTVAQAYGAAERGYETASLQSTPMAERLYAAVGFRDLGRLLEFVPPVPAARA